MTDHDQPQPPAQDGSTPPGRRGSRRRLALIGTGGAAVLLAGGALFATQSRDAEQESLPEPAAMAPMEAATSSAPAPSASASAAAAAGTAGAPSATPSAAETSPPEVRAENRDRAPEAKQTEKPEDTPRKVRKEIQEARAKAAEEGVELKRPLEQKSAEGGVSQRTETTADGTIRITTARHDLTGQAPLSIVADRGTAEGNARCTNKIRFSEGVPAQERPTLLLCWRTSAERSVVTMAVTPKGKPNIATSVKLIEKEWAKLG